jgi:hypothetical protein
MDGSIMNVLIISPGYPADMPDFTRGLAASGAWVYGIGDQPPAALPDTVRRSLTGFTHMEWYRKSDGEVVFGEIAARPPGAHQVDQMKYACGFDVFEAWGEAITRGRLGTTFERTFNVATVYKRARGVGRITRVEGTDELQRRFGEHVVWNTLSTPGMPRRNWRQTLVSDGFVMLRHPDLQSTLEMADAVGTDLHLYAE